MIMKKFKIRSLSALLLTFLLCLSMTACGVNINTGDSGEAEKADKTEASADSKTAENEKKEETASTDEEEPDPDFADKKVVESGEFGDYKFEIVGAELAEDSDDESAIRFWYDFTNNSDDETSSAFWESTVTAYQDGEELEKAYVPDENYEEYGWNDSLNVRPGVSVRCLEDFSYNEDGGPVRFEIINWSGDTDEIVTVVYHADEVPGPPTDEFKLAAVDDPTWTDDYDWEGDTDADVHILIDNAEETEDYRGETLVRVYVEITNNGEDPIVANDVFYPYAYQDGLELEHGYANDEVEEDDNATREIRKGESIRVAYCFELRSDSPVEVEGPLGYTSGANKIGGVFETK